jgi:hypothetical protein
MNGCYRSHAMPYQGDALGVDINLATYKFHRCHDVISEVAIEYSLALTVPSKIEGEGSDASAHQSLGAGTHGAVPGSYPMAKNRCREGAITYREKHLPMQCTSIRGEIYCLFVPLQCCIILRGPAPLGL